MTLLHLDVSAGAAGDMLLAALLDTDPDGAIRHAVTTAVAAVLPHAELATTPVRRGGLAALRLEISPGREQPPRDHAEIQRLLAVLPAPVRAPSQAVFRRLAQAESRVHGVAEDTVHFHEVGAWDSIADIVGVCAAITALDPDAISAEPVGVGAGRVGGAHGSLPVPPPAVTEVLRAGGVPHAPGPADFEACTPTGAALIAHFARSWRLPSWRLTGVGVGAGTRDPAGHANVVRALLGEPTDDAATPAAVLLETNIDDLDPRLWPGIQQQLLAAGASDAWLTDIRMKKGRPAWTLSVLCARDRRDTLAGVILTSTSAIGMRVQPVAKLTAARRFATVSVAGHDVAVKIATWHGRVVNVQPEWEDVAAAAAATHLSAKHVLALAHAAAAPLWDTDPQQR